MDDTIFTLVALITRERLYRADKEDDLTPAEFGAVSIRPDPAGSLNRAGSRGAFKKVWRLQQLL